MKQSIQRYVMSARFQNTFLGGALGGLVSGALFPVGILAGVLASGSTTTLTGKMLNAEHESNHHNQNLSLALKKSPHRCWCLSV